MGTKQPSNKAIITAAVYNNDNRPRYFQITKQGKCALISIHGKLFPAAITARGSLSDSQVIPISHTALGNVNLTPREGESFEGDKALIYSWQSDLGDIFAIGCTTEQHRSLQPGAGKSPIHRRSNGNVSNVFTYTDAGGYYIRRVDTDGEMEAQWEVYTDLAEAGKILFALRVPAPKLVVAP